MTIKVVFFDLGGVLVRTEDMQPRTCLAASLGLTYEAIESLVFDSKSSLQASLGAIDEYQHWQQVVRSLDLPETEIQRVRTEFFAGDRIDHDLLDLMRSLRKTLRVGLISNAWSGLREWITRQKFADLFDDMLISAELGFMKPDGRIYRTALERLQVLPAESVFLDDSLKNVTGARQAGMHAIHFVQPGLAVAELKALLAG